MTLPVSIVILLVVFGLTAVRRLGRLHLRIWQIMLAGACAALWSGAIAPAAALRAIDPDVMLFLFGMFVIGQALEQSGYLSRLAYRTFNRARSADALILLILFGVGGASALLMNDTLAIVGTPVVLMLAREHRMQPKVLLLALAFAVTIGSVASPIGNPQNLLIAVHSELPNPFVTFFQYLAVPSAINLLCAYLLLKLLFRETFHAEPLRHHPGRIQDPPLARLARVSLALLIALIALKIAAAFLGYADGFRLTYIALAACVPLLLASPRRFAILRGVDWHTLVFFAAMFVLVQAVWDSGFVQDRLRERAVDVAAPGAILGISVLLSQLVSNVPLVALYLPLLAEVGAGTRELMLLAAGGTIAGNLFILGAASNVIIVQAAERKSAATLTFLDFAKVGVPLTAINAAVYWSYLYWQPV